MTRWGLCFVFALCIRVFAEVIGGSLSIFYLGKPRPLKAFLVVIVAWNYRCVSLMKCKCVRQAWKIRQRENFEYIILYGVLMNHLETPLYI